MDSRYEYILQRLRDIARHRQCPCPRSSSNVVRQTSGVEAEAGPCHRLQLQLEQQRLITGEVDVDVDTELQLQQVYTDSDDLKRVNSLVVPHRSRPSIIIARHRSVTSLLPPALRSPIAMDVIGLLLLLLMGIIISTSSGSWTTGRTFTESLDEQDDSLPFESTGDALPDAQQLAVVPHHISNQHQILRRLSETNPRRGASGRGRSGGSGDSELDMVASEETVGLSLGLGQEEKAVERPPKRMGHKTSQARLHGSAAFLRRVMLRNTSVTCNDGTTAGYYLRHPPQGSRRWIVFLEGGWHCFSTVSCHQRWLRMRNLMTSAHWPEMRSGEFSNRIFLIISLNSTLTLLFLLCLVGGIMSPNEDENPHWHDANHVFIPYCSSDSWSGDSPAKAPGDLAFLGTRIVEQVLLELLPKGLYDGRMLLLAGSSAGAAGVLVNLDRVSSLMAAMGSKVEVRGLADSGWFLDNKPFDFHAALAAETGDGSHLPPPRKASCNENPLSCAPIDTIKQGIKMWNGQVPASCRAAYPTEPWRCFFGYRIYPTLRTPLFVVQWVFDEAQMTVDNVG